MPEDSNNTQVSAPAESTAPETVATPTDSTSTTPAAPVVDANDDQKLFSTLCYIPVLTILISPYAVSRHPQNNFVALNAANGLGLFVVWFLNFIILLPLTPFVGGIVVLLLILLSVYGGMMAWTGKELTIPVVKQLGDKLLSFVKGFVSTAGKNVVTGMSQAVNKAGEAVQGVASKVVDTVTPTQPEEAPKTQEPTQPSEPTPEAAAPVVEQPATPSPDAPVSDTQNK